MVASNLQGVRIAGIASAVPKTVRTLADDAQVFGQAEIDRISQNIGVRQRHVASDKTCASDLCFAAAERLLSEVNWEKESVEALIFVTQTPDHVMPASACLLQSRLGLSKQCASFDVNQGCAGYVYGLWLASHLARGGCRRVLLLVGDTVSRLVSPQDRTLATLFGDAGTATALEQQEGAAPWTFQLGSDGSGGALLSVQAGAFRKPYSDASSQRLECGAGIVRSEAELAMDGAEVFTFTLREVPAVVDSLLTQSQTNLEQFDACVFHQANRFMLDYLAKRVRVPNGKMVIGLTNYGNTSSASIPLAMTTELSQELSSRSMRLLLVGFGAGLAWGAAAVECGPCVVPPLIMVP